MKIVARVIITGSCMALLSACSSDSGSSNNDTNNTGTPPIGNVSGVWSISETATSSTAGCSNFRSYLITVEQSGNSLTVTDDVGSKYNGQINGDTLNWTGSYPEPPGTVTINSLTATVSSDCQTLTSNSTWSYSETGFSCSGTTTASGTRTSGGNSC